MTIQDARAYLQLQLAAVYENREAANIADWVLESLTGLSRSARLVRQQEHLTTDQKALFDQHLPDLLRHRPVQYVLGESWFHGLRFHVNENVLIPRPETEELVDWIINEHQHQQLLRILDIGTGSGCIPIALKKALPQATVYSCDVSAGALEVARKNAADLEAEIHFIQQNILDDSLWEQLPEVDLIVSNPPYIPEHNKESMHANVLEHEPHLALFVSNNDPLTFYRAIAELSGKKLKEDGDVYAEIHEDLGAATLALFQEKGFGRVTLRRDMQEKDRMIKAAGLTSR
ncbi:peptide chain release factor N(5)-glutamine methyltransferase [Pseudobacter ginsenosidimutans]|uniref:Release factor glutamine methyltransferase n=1 Tax=Pseudobacter ginsenosidimutans TaxID=661488 RepID=A0A4Q7MFX2_9BACT|nr:peptide chain release factor N(5)-glutamine methyltransferase [Pseudobacter ginsenosidimutans]QEC45545.1 peptide chain release factor N(5)-glutamine methyltransferase [Pseudobacter ginsenosidimutans]RZS67086.1 release factor glutamine methyltransferase [Pseudobacter ginsenosidimutans]